jgi:hypothetical protein
VCNNTFYSINKYAANATLQSHNNPGFDPSIRLTKRNRRGGR